MNVSKEAPKHRHNQVEDPNFLIEHIRPSSSSFHEKNFEISLKPRPHQTKSSRRMPRRQIQTGVPIWGKGGGHIGTRKSPPWGGTLCPLVQNQADSGSTKPQRTNSKMTEFIQFINWIFDDSFKRQLCDSHLAHWLPTTFARGGGEGKLLSA